jgi:starch phosphorylase
MWRDVWPKAEQQEVPIVHVTNGIHIPSYISRELLRIYDRYLGPGWTEDPDNEKVWQRADDIPDTELWRTHERCRTRLVHFARRRVARQLKARGVPPAQQEVAEKILDPEALTICFGRRFATYKRATLLFREPDRLAKFLCHSDRPAQLIFAGKAHPADNAGKEMIRRIIELSNTEPFRSCIAFIEDYDINVARYMVQGADIWLNTPTRPLEACGTSGMKAAANGALNVSILDGWWDEGYIGDNGWAIGRGEEYNDTQYQDEIESRALYDLLEESVKPLFYEKGVDDLPREWIRLMKRSIRTICPVFNSHRMVSEYVETCYVPAAKASSELRVDSFAALRGMVAWKKKMENDWNRIAIRKVEILDETLAKKGKPVEVIVSVDTAGHNPNEVKAELLHGPIDLWENFKECQVTRLTPDLSRPGTDGGIIFSGLMPLTYTGLYGYMVRLTPEHPNLPFSQSFDLVHRG